jgi:hypothetical protein
MGRERGREGKGRGKGEGKGREGGVNKQNGGQANKDPSRQRSISFSKGTTNVLLFLVYGF